MDRAMHEPQARTRSSRNGGAHVLAEGAVVDDLCRFTLRGTWDEVMPEGINEIEARLAENCGRWFGIVVRTGLAILSSKTRSAHSPPARSKPARVVIDGHMTLLDVTSQKSDELANEHS